MKIKLPLIPWDVELKKVSSINYQKNERELTDKVFVIGFNKTGTTTLSQVLKSFGYKLGNQKRAEVLGIYWKLTNDTDKIIRFCKTANAFQDVPFSTPELYKDLDLAFPNSKFILSVRESASLWYNSLIRFHTKKFSRNPNMPPSELDLRTAKYGYEGMALDYFKLFYGYPEIPLYDKEAYQDMYLKHVKDVQQYFKKRESDMIQINVAQQEDFFKLKKFLRFETDMEDFPWTNRTN